MNFVPQTSIVDCEVSCDNMFHELIDFAKNTNGSCDPRFLIGIYVSFNGYFLFIYPDLGITVMFCITDGIGEICDFGGVTLSKIIRKEVAKLEITLRDIK